MMMNIGGRGMLGLLNRGCWHAVVLRCPCYTRGHY